MKTKEQNSEFRTGAFFTYKIALRFDHQCLLHLKDYICIEIQTTL